MVGTQGGELGGVEQGRSLLSLHCFRPSSFTLSCILLLTLLDLRDGQRRDRRPRRRRRPALGLVLFEAAAAVTAQWVAIQLGLPFYALQM